MDRTGKSLAAVALVGFVLLLLTGAGLYFQEKNNLEWFIGAAFAQGAIYLAGVWLVLRPRRAQQLHSAALAPSIGGAPAASSVEGPPGGGLHAAVEGQELEARHRSRNTTLGFVLLVALLLRIGALVAPPYLTDDIYRYIWDGRVLAAGINPYRYVPESAELESLRDAAIYPQINRSEYAPTIYPPVAQAIFLAATRVSESVTWMKMVMVGFEALAVWMLVRLLASLGLPAERVLIYAWNPLAVWEFAGGGHIDAAAIAFIALALWARRRNSHALTGVTLACATLTKFYPAAIFPALYRRWDWKMPAAFVATVIFGYLPFAKVGRRVLGFLPGYIAEEGLLSGERFYPWKLIQKMWSVPSFYVVAYVGVLLLALIAISAWLIFREQRHDEDFLVHATVLAGVSTVLFSPHYPWYFAWLLPLLVFVPYVPLLCLTSGAFILYESHWQETPESIFRNSTLLYLPFVVLVAAQWMWRHSGER